MLPPLGRVTRQGQLNGIRTLEKTMNRKVFILISTAAIIAVAAIALMRENRPPRTPVVAEHVPAHYETAPDAGSLGPTLAPDRFIGKTKEAYQVAREIPQTLAQLPCYCHCDEGFGHKSLHSCFEDQHAASCAVCTEEALRAYQLQTVGRLSPAQIRQRIIAEYGRL